MRHPGTLLALPLLLLAGACGPARMTYVPNPPMSGAPSIRLKVAVLPFLVPGATAQDTRAPRLDGEDWGRFLADDLLSAGVFSTVRFVPRLEAGEDADLVLRGRIVRAFLDPKTPSRPLFEAHLAAQRRDDGRTFWEGTLRFEQDCGALKPSEVLPRILHDLFRQAREGLVAGLRG
jgi:hypothetical protein